MGDLNVALRLQGTFIDFQPSSTVIGRKRRRSCPPCLQHGPDDTVELPNGLFYLTRCATRESCYNDLQINEDRDYLWALIERTQRLPQIRSRNTDGDVGATSDESNGLESEGGWTCACGVYSSPGALFCWSCGCSKQVVRPCDESPRRKSKQAGVGKASTRAVGNVKKKQAAEEILVSSRVSTASSHENGEAPLGTVTSHYLLPTEQHAITLSMDSLPTFASTSVDDSLAPLGEGIDNGTPPDSLSVGVESVDGISQDITTLMICALPFRVTSEELLEAVDSLGFEGTYDFVYMPSRSTKKCGKVRPGNVGYAFVNFRNPEDASKFAMIFPGFTFPGVESDKQILVRAAACQGYDANCCLHLFNKKHQSSVMTFPERISE
jgi:hypothetical protein